MFHLGARILYFDVGEGVRAADRPSARNRTASNCGRSRRSATLSPAPVGVLAVAGGNALGDDGAAGVLADVDHLGAGVGLLPVAGQGHRVELAHRVFAAQHAAWILPGDGRTGLDLVQEILESRPLHKPRLVTKL